MRLDDRHELRGASRVMSQLEGVVEASTLDPKARDLIKPRDSQINGCAYYVDMHAKDVRAMGKDAPATPPRASGETGPFAASASSRARHVAVLAAVICSSSTARTKNVDVDRGP
jgi:AhpD family alkylhydroperoxidase